MKVLFIDHPEADYLAAILFLGLCEVLGADNVVDWPRKKSYHGESHVYTLPPGYWNSGAPGFTAPFAWFPAQAGREWPDDEVQARIGEFDLVILASPRQYNRDALRDLVRRVGRDALRKLVFLDGEDDVRVHWDPIRAFRPEILFKRELTRRAEDERPVPLRLEPFPFATPLPPSAAKPKDIDIAFLGGATWPGRAAAHDALSGAFGSRYVGGFQPYEAYLDIMARARIGVSVRGHGMDTYRYWEIPSFEGTMLLADRLPLLRGPYAMQEGVHMAYFDGPEDLVRVASEYLGDEPRRAAVAHEGNLHLRNHHTPSARARQLLSACGLG